MSIYSGFATRSQEESYDRLVFELVQFLAAKILKTYHAQSFDQIKFSKILKDIFLKLSLMQKQKYLQPNISNALFDIINYFLKQEQPQQIQLQQKKISYWVKKQQNEKSTFTTNSYYNLPMQFTSRQTFKNIQIPNKLPNSILQKHQDLKFNRQTSTITVPIRNKINKSIARHLQDQRQNRQKQKSLRRFQEKQSSQTNQNNQSHLPKGICTHCYHQIVPKDKKIFPQRKKQESDSVSKRQLRSSKLQIPELVKDYIESTNRKYMKTYRKRKVSLYPQL